MKYQNQVIKRSVSQGTIFAPFLFLIYMNDLTTVCKKTYPIMFADDSNLFISGRGSDLIMKTLNEE